MKFVIPVRNCVITNHFNAPASYPFAPTRKQLHEGIDFAPKMYGTRTLVYAANQGTVLQIGFDSRGYGNYVIIKHNARFYTWYGHLKEVFVVENQSVDLTSQLGIMGETGHATGVHLHFNVQDMLLGSSGYVVAKVVDPEPLLVSTLDNLSESWYTDLIKFLGSPKLVVKGV